MKVRAKYGSYFPADNRSFPWAHEATNQTRRIHIHEGLH